MCIDGNPNLDTNPNVGGGVSRWQPIQAGLVPVLLSGRFPSVVELTDLPWKIDAADYPSPEALADRLLFLDQHDEEYMKYHEWRRHPSSVSEAFVRYLAEQLPTPVERDAIATKKIAKAPERFLATCRLCDRDYIDQLAREPHKTDFKSSLSRRDVRQKYGLDPPASRVN